MCSLLSKLSFIDTYVSEATSESLLMTIGYGCLLLLEGFFITAASIIFYSLAKGTSTRRVPMVP